MASKHSEQAKIAVRNARKNVLDTLKRCNLPEDAEKKGEKKVVTLKRKEVNVK